MDTGLGIRAYSVIEQGKIGMILSGKPQERRKLIEEAAGITRYKARKSIAEVKLQEATANLLRLDDVISEVERALRSLKRQAGAARRYQEKEVEYRELLEKVLARPLGRARRPPRRAAGARSRRRAPARPSSPPTSTATRPRSPPGRERLDELARALAERHQKVAELAATIEGRQEFLKANRQTLKEIGERPARAAASPSAASRRSQAYVEALDVAGRAPPRAGRRARAGGPARSSQDEQQIAAAERDLQQVAARVDAVRGQLAAAVDEINGLRQRVQQAQIELERGNFRRHHLDQELAQHAHELKQAAEAPGAGRRTRSRRLGGRARRRKTAEQERVAAALEVDDAPRGRGLRSASAASKTSSRARGSASASSPSCPAPTPSAGPPWRRPSPRPASPRPPASPARRRRSKAGSAALDVYLGSLADAVVLEPGATALDLRPGPRRPLGRDPHRAPARGCRGAARCPLVDDPAVVLSLGEALGLPEELAAALPPAFLVAGRGRRAARPRSIPASPS